MRLSKKDSNFLILITSMINNLLVVQATVWINKRRKINNNSKNIQQRINNNV